MKESVLRFKGKTTQFWFWFSVYDFYDIGPSSVVYIFHKGTLHKYCVAMKCRWICIFFIL